MKCERRRGREKQSAQREKQGANRSLRFRLFYVACGLRLFSALDRLSVYFVFGERDREFVTEIAAARRLALKCIFISVMRIVINKVIVLE